MAAGWNYPRAPGRVFGKSPETSKTVVGAAWGAVLAQAGLVLSRCLSRGSSATSRGRRQCLGQPWDTSPFLPAVPAVPACGHPAPWWPAGTSPGLATLTGSMRAAGSHLAQHSPAPRNPCARGAPAAPGWAQGGRGCPARPGRPLTLLQAEVSPSSSWRGRHLPSSPPQRGWEALASVPPSLDHGSCQGRWHSPVSLYTL